MLESSGHATSGASSIGILSIKQARDRDDFGEEANVGLSCSPVNHSTSAGALLMIIILLLVVREG